MKKISLSFFFLLLLTTVEARHIIGGEIVYEYLRPGTALGSRVFRITLRLFRDEHTTGAPLPASVGMALFNNDNNSIVGTYIDVPLDSSKIVPANPLPLCITNPPDLDYRVGYYSFEATLPANNLGFSATFQTCCRIDNINNTGNSVGATYTERIPPTNDNSPSFNLGIDVVCYQKPFTLDFGATDPDSQDSLVYYFCNAYNGGAAIDASFSTPAAPPYASIVYTNGFVGTAPLGNNATINRRTGLISGIAPNSGSYVVSVCINTYRNGIYVSTHRKDIVITVALCDFAGAQLEPNYLSCDGFSFDFFNLNTSPLNNSYYWNFGDPGSGPADSSALSTPRHVYSDTGIYTIKMIVNGGTGCSDTAEAQVKVYPGFFPAFSANTPICKGTPLQFSDQTTTNYGSTNFWQWNFGDNSSLADTSRLQSPIYTYLNTGNYNATLIVSSNKGCIDTINKQIKVIDKAMLQITNDTTICSADTLSLIANSSIAGNFIWSPSYNISNINSNTPLVSPDITTTYFVSYSDSFGCVATDSAKVSILDNIIANAGNDTTICKGDALILSLNSNAIYFNWSPTSTLNDPTIKNPAATPSNNYTTYYVIASVSAKCLKTDSITVHAVAYPNAIANNDTTICLGGSANLFASGGTYYLWTPATFLNATNIKNPSVLQPNYGITYIVKVTDTFGCPKPVYDSVNVRVLQVIANAGYDTSVVYGQPLQLQATGGTGYLWTPGTWLNNNTISNPVAHPEDNIQYIVTVTAGPGCIGYDTINVKVFRFAADLLVPSAFTPNGDGINDVIRPLAIGMKSADIFRVYNRWGQLLFSTSEIGKGWNGTFRGAQQSSGTYVWYAEGITFDDRRLAKKGYVVLVR